MSVIQPANVVTGSLPKSNFMTKCKLSYRKFVKSRQLLIIFLPGLIFYLLFRYVPMYGVLMAFKKYSPFLGVFKSPWIGLKNFQNFFSSPDFLLLFRNTFLIGINNLLWGFPAPILFALVLNECRIAKFKKGVQTISYLPSFLSSVIICSMAIDFLSPSGGIINSILSSFGIKPIYFMIKPEWFRTVYVGTGIWAGVGTGSIVYLAALSNIDPQLYEAANCDGCGRLRAAWNITIPCILPTVATMLILHAGSIINVGYEKILLLYNAATYSTADVFSTYVYRRGLQRGDFGLGTSVGLFNSVIALVLLYSTNYLSRRFSETSLW